MRAIVLCSQGKHFCAGNNFGNQQGNQERDQRTETSGNPLYTAATRLFATKTPVIGAIQGAAVGGGFGLAVMPDFRVVCPEARFTANFVKLGFHPGFGLTHTLPRPNRASKSTPLVSYWQANWRRTGSRMGASRRIDFARQTAR